MNETTIHPALDEFDAAMRTPRQRLAALAKENAELTSEANALRRETTDLKAQLTEARRQPVALLPEITAEVINSAHREYRKDEYPLSNDALASAWNAILLRHFRETAEARVRPALDVEAVARDVWGAMDSCVQIRTGLLNTIKDVLRRHLTDVPAKPADELLMNALARVQAETRLQVGKELRAAYENGDHLLGMVQKLERGQ
jgi:regulator of replication initiation timing